jgi:hypothetical protein
MRKCSRYSDSLLAPNLSSNPIADQQGKTEGRSCDLPVIVLPLGINGANFLLRMSWKAASRAGRSNRGMVGLESKSVRVLR